jgi:transglutaminase-like putative cysteine protease
MSLFQRFILASSAATIAILLLATPTFAKDFLADYSVDYTLHPDTALMHVTQHVTLTNQVANLRASSYSLTLENNNFQNMSARDSSGIMHFTESKDSQGSPVLVFTFNDRVVGIGNKLKWTIDYDSPTLAQHHGQTWDITIPRVKEHPSYDIGSYAAILHIPKSVGPAAFVSPAASSDISTNDTFVYTFSKDQVLPTGIVATFGQAQVFSFTLKYHLHNPNLGQSSTKIALPPDIANYQQIIYNQLLPAPVKMETDADGNALATYYLASHADLDVTFTGWAKTVADHPDLQSKAMAKDLPVDVVLDYTKEQPFWQTSDPDIIKKTKEITHSSKPVVENARAIYNYVTTTLKYNTARINKDLKRLGASAAFNKPDNAVCMEFTDVFVTMARIAGIPAREVDGYAYTSDSANHPIFYPGLGSDILHAWAEIYLPDSGWVMVDPTWGSTTGGVDFFGRIDLNRIAFAVKGISSTTPYAAGSYKTNDKQDGDVQVSFSKTTIQPTAELKLDLTDQNVIAGIGSTASLSLKNSGNVTLHQLKLLTTPHSPLLSSRPTDAPTSLLPGETAAVWLPLRSASWLTNSSGSLDISVTGKDIATTSTSATKHYTIKIEPFFAAIVLPLLALLAIVGAVLGGSWFGLHKLYEKSDQDPSVGTVTRLISRFGHRKKIS